MELGIGEQDARFDYCLHRQRANMKPTMAASTKVTGTLGASAEDYTAPTGLNGMTSWLS